MFYRLPTSFLFLMVFAVPGLLIACGGDESEPVTDAGSDVSPDVTTDGSASSPDSDVEADADTTPSVCFDDIAPGEVQVFFDGFSGSEGISFGPDGLLYVGGGGKIWRFDAQGVRTELAEVPNPLGLAPAPDGVWVASKGPSDSPAVVDGGVYRVTTDGTVTALSLLIPSPNAIVEAANGTLLTSDDFDTRVWRVDADGTTSEWLTEVPSPNGLAYSPDRTVLYIASTFTDAGEVWAWDVDADGLPIGAGRQIASLGPSATNDGLAVDANGLVYVAANLEHRIVIIDPAGGEPVNLAAEGMLTPASLAFGNGEGFDPCSIYVTELLGSKILRIGVGVPGAPVGFASVAE
jgi:gluconolactonase